MASASVRVRSLTVLVQALVIVCVVIMCSCSYTCEGRRSLLPFFREEKPPIALKPVPCFIPPCPKN
ncbi:hypothetical protein C2845_PM16G04370 [Panicum miliaceum]|uniref:Uncharacterized protein n=1 Tax=Panicum miliaceum TaxID=4540 RepID=A0A3L6PYP4_PANMI|nr:hypothetical protein C2845_PM16G04370 [Panicum miliaceum]